jgi:predicted nucleic acid-binding protein
VIVADALVLVPALVDYAELALERHPHLLLARAWELRNSVSAHDAQYVALAELLDVPLVTGDERLSRAPGLRCAVDLLR